MPILHLASEFRVDYYPGLTNGSGFNYDTSTRASKPDGMGDLEPLGSPTLKSDAGLTSDHSLAENGSTFDLGIDASYLSSSGSLRIDSSSYSAINKSELSLSMKTVLDFGTRSLVLPAATLQSLKAEFEANPEEFTTIYGTHYVSGADYHSYVRATFWKSQVSSSTASQMGLSMAFDTGFVFGSASSSVSLQQLTKATSETESVNLQLETNVIDSNANSSIFQKPEDLVNFEQAFASITQRLSEPQPIPYAFYLTPWKDILATTFTGNMHTVLGDMVADYRRVSTLAARLTDLQDNPNKYSYLGDNVLDYYVAQLPAILTQASDLLTRIKAVKNSPPSQGSYTPLRFSTNFVLPPSHRCIQFYSGVNSLYIDVLINGADNFGAAQIKSGNVVTRHTSLISRPDVPPTNSLTRSIIDHRGDGVPNPLPLSGDLSDWNFEVLDKFGSVVLAVPLAQLRDHVVPLA